MKVATKMVSLFALCDSDTVQFKLLLKEVEPVNNDLLMYNSVHCLSRGRVLTRPVEYLNEMEQTQQHCSPCDN
jgi:hypothetical protein